MNHRYETNIPYSMYERMVLEPESRRAVFTYYLDELKHRMIADLNSYMLEHAEFNKSLHKQTDEKL